jgi:hypothetical protein
VQAIDAAPSHTLSDGKAVPLPHLPGQPVFEASAPAVGANTRALLAEAGMGASSIDALIAGKLARQHVEAS